MPARTTTPEPRRARRRPPAGAGHPGRLTELRIRGLGAIDDVTLEFGAGLTVVTGETGAGKTMVVTGLTLLFGGRADPGRVRASGRAGVEGRLVAARRTPRCGQRAADAGADPDDDGSLILARTISAEGRSRAFLGGRSVPVGVVAELAEGLLAVHGQTDQLRLSRPAEQRRALDRYAGAAHLALLDRYREAHDRWRTAGRRPRPPPQPGARARPGRRRAAARPGGDRGRRPRARRGRGAGHRRPSGSATPTRCAPPPTRPAWRWSAT